MVETNRADSITGEGIAAGTDVGERTETYSLRNWEVTGAEVEAEETDTEGGRSETDTVERLELIDI